MSSNEVLTELELEVYLQSRKRTKEQIAESLRIELSEVERLLESASRKMPRPVTLESPLFDVLPRPLFKLEKKVGQPQVGTMKVGSRIVELLSKGIYSAPWNSLKELISNSFDADATKVEIAYSPQERKLVVYDDGIGMDFTDFDEHFTFIVRSLKREQGMYTPRLKRPIIGKIGIGFVAVSELCEEIKITSAKKGSDTYFEALIDFSRMRAEEARHKEFYEISQFTLTNHTKKDLDEHYTKVELMRLKESFVDTLDNKAPQGSKYPLIKAESFEDLVEEMARRQVKDIRSELGPLWEFLLSFATVIPIEYLDNGPLLVAESIDTQKDVLPCDYRNALRLIEEIKESLRNYRFKVFYNGLELRKPILLPNEEDIRKGEYGKDLCLFPVRNTIKCFDPITNEQSEISYKGYFYYQRTRIIPQQLRGMMIRIKNVAIGGPSFDFWGHPFVGDDIYFPQTMGEVYFDIGLEDSMNIDRSTFKTSHQEYSSTKNALHRFLRDVVFASAKKMYFKRRSTRAISEDIIIVESRTTAIKERLGKGFKIHKTRKFSHEPIRIDQSEKSVTLNVLSDPFAGFKKKDRVLLEDVAIAIEIAVSQSSNKTEIKDVFWKTLRRITEYRRS